MRRSTTRLSVQPLEGREVPACVVGLGGPGNLLINGDGASDTVIINDNGAGTISGTATGVGAFTYSGITGIYVGTGAGNDRVVYNLVRNMLPSQYRLVSVDVGAGNDTFTGNLFNAKGVGSDLMKGADLLLSIHGSRGNDRLQINAQHDVDVADTANLNMVMFGEDGNDIILGYYDGENDGKVWMRDFDGGNGDDIIRGFVKEDVGSTGTSVGILHGRDGNDNLALFMNTQNPPLAGFIDGGTGFDSAIHTANVNVINVP